MEWEDRFFAKLLDPDEMGESEYASIYQHLQSVVESANVGGDDPREMVLATLDQLVETINYIREVVDALGEKE